VPGAGCRTTNLITFGSGAQITAAGAFQPASSRALKHDIRGLDLEEVLAALRTLQPVKFAYNATPEQANVGFIAEELPDLVATADRTHLDPVNIVGVLTKVVQDQDRKIGEQEATIAGQQREIAGLRADYQATLSSLLARLDALEKDR
jgi:hypothetical protein